MAGPGGDAAVLLLKGTPNGLALSSDVNPVYCGLDPRRGGQQAVAEAARNLACVGAEPAGLTDCLNFGNPENPEIMWQFRECVRGMAEACRALGVPVVSGNVSLYNETDGRSILPTPTVAMVGVIPDLGNVPTAHFRQPGERVVLLGADRSEFGGSAYLRLLHGVEAGRPPAVDLDAEAPAGAPVARRGRAGPGAHRARLRRGRARRGARGGDLHPGHRRADRRARSRRATSSRRRRHGRSSPARRATSIGCSRSPGRWACRRARPGRWAVRA